MWLSQGYPGPGYPAVPSPLPGTSYTCCNAENGGDMKPAPAAEQLGTGSACSSAGEHFLPQDEEAVLGNMPCPVGTH